ncbi:type II toxin-antitoxin system VapB family antitoxin [Streptomyces europaeiscabiei]|uniref:type II toxin-antitoxin system VapB family antitoxin n=1 Tax=Streptomyces europaeiscabiei TaxID=146819 RepID=UPI0029BAA60C|nr:type II toxin-antitoxin system VapB family antitoxin [Streptomyces europaeiscabiei]MDX2764217.1 type II toxin-antitoxin system VapB family antitoxin [Streptomyces europaeiscabiei]MDX2774419.1 type II toxin-antitoxin system VapB family antitoxin [Streptomyces europaeiscabiei]
MSRTLVDIDDDMLAFAQQQLGAKTKRDTINRALTIAAAGQRGRPGPGTAVAPGERRRVPRLRRSRRTGALRAVTYLADTSAVWRLLRRQIGTPGPTAWREASSPSARRSRPS